MIDRLTYPFRSLRSWWRDGLTLGQKRAYIQTNSSSLFYDLMYSKDSIEEILERYREGQR
jgi:hypothetical protein